MVFIFEEGSNIRLTYNRQMAGNSIIELPATFCPSCLKLST